MLSRKVSIPLNYKFKKDLIKIFGPNIALLFLKGRQINII